jgi:hypothetical protein
MLYSGAKGTMTPNNDSARSLPNRQPQAAGGPITEVQQIELDSPKLPFNSEANALTRYLFECWNNPWVLIEPAHCTRESNPVSSLLRWRKLAIANVVQRKRQHAGCQLGPVMNAKLTEDRMDVVLHGLLRKI